MGVEGENNEATATSMFGKAYMLYIQEVVYSSSISFYSVGYNSRSRDTPAIPGINTAVGVILATLD